MIVASITHNVTVVLSALGVVGQVLVAVMLLVGLLALVGLRAPLDLLRRLLWGWELWCGFVVAAIATGGSLFFSEFNPFFPCELCWFQRICMYPMSYLLLVFAWRGYNRIARYLIVFPVAGACVSTYHLLIENNVIKEPLACLQSAPGGCGVKWINEFGYITIPTLALTGFLLLIGFLVLASTGAADETATLPADAER
jgi:disulfide bond formation protein DsbB